MSRVRLTPAAECDLAAIYVHSFLRFGVAQADGYTALIDQRWSFIWMTAGVWTCSASSIPA